jgi:hypothetical protein
MAQREQKGNREAKKPKKEKIKTIGAAPSQKGGTAAERRIRQEEIALLRLALADRFTAWLA